MTRIRSESERISSSSSETSRIARPSSRSSIEAAVDELDRADVEPARRLRGDQDARVAVDLAREHDLLLVAAGEAARARLRAAAADVVLLDQPGAALDEAAGNSQPNLRVGRAPVVVQGDVLGDRELEHEAAPLPVLGNVAEPGLEVPVSARGRDVLAGDRHASRRRPCAGPSSRRSARSARCRRCRRARRSRRPGRRARGRAPSRSRGRRTRAGPSTSSSVSRRIRRALLDAQQHLAPDHQAGEALLGRAGRRQRLDLLAAPQHGDPVGDLGHLVQLVADEDDRLPLLGEAADDLEQLPASCGVSTAVGSSSTRMSALR